jgi:hypothetical protein
MVGGGWRRSADKLRSKDFKLEPIAGRLLITAYQYAGQGLQHREVLADEQHSHRLSGVVTLIVYLTITHRERGLNTFQSR